MTALRVGCGWDIHPLVAGRKLILGGLEIPHSKGLQGHSDSDALVHAICDALLGAMGREISGVTTQVRTSDSRIFRA